MENTEKNKMPLVRFMVVSLAICMVAYIVYTNFVSKMMPENIDARLRIATGVDLLGGFGQKDIQVTAYKAQSEYLNQRNLACINDFDWSKKDINTFLEHVQKKDFINNLNNVELTRIEKCLNQIIDGPKRIFGNTATQHQPRENTSNVSTQQVQSPSPAQKQVSVVSQSEPKVFRREPYEPAKYGPSGMTIRGLGNEPFTVRCSGTYSQLFSTNNREAISCKGIFNSGMTQNEINALRKKDQSKYGEVLVDMYPETAIVNLNISPNQNAYSDIIGKVYIDFLR